MSAVEIARLANIALAEVGVDAVVYATPEHRAMTGRSVSYPRDSAPLDKVRKATLLARLHLFGPDAETLCDDHPTKQQGSSQCGLVPVVDALRGRLCENAASK